MEIPYHPWAGEDLSLKIDERDQTIWICMLLLKVEVSEANGDLSLRWKWSYTHTN